MSRAGSVRTWLSLVAFIAIVAAMDYALLDYLISQGLDSKLQPIQIGSYQFSFPLIGLTFAGVLIVAIAAWSNISTTMPITTLREMSQLETVRILRAAAVALFFFALTLFGPYLLGTNVFWRQIASLSGAFPQLAAAFQGLFYAIEPAMALDAMSKLAISQNVAAGALVVVSLLIGHYQRRIRRAK